MKILVTGGCGFIGSNFIRYLLKDSEIDEKIRKDLFIINLDKQTYAGKGKNIEHMRLANNEAYHFIKWDICDKESVESVFSLNPEIIFNFAVESHVDRSIANSEDFVRTNVLGTTNLLEAARRYGAKKFVQISTD